MKHRPLYGAHRLMRAGLVVGILAGIAIFAILSAQAASYAPTTSQTLRPPMMDSPVTHDEAKAPKVKLKIAAGTPQAKPAVVVEKEKTTIKFQVQLYSGSGDSKKPASQVTSQTYTLKPYIPRSGIKIDSVQALEGQNWHIAPDGSKATVTINHASSEISFSVTAVVQSSKPGIMAVQLSGKVNAGSSGTLNAISDPLDEFSVAKVKIVEEYKLATGPITPSEANEGVELKRPAQKPGLPAKRFVETCIMSLTANTLTDVKVTLVNPDKRLGLFKAGAVSATGRAPHTLTLTIPKFQSRYNITKFQISGEAPSAKVGDAVIKVHLTGQNPQKSQAVKRKFTVFHFGGPKEICDTVNNPYNVELYPRRAFVPKRISLAPIKGNSIAMVAQADILPQGFCNTISHQYRVSMVQYCIAPINFLIKYTPLHAKFNNKFNSRRPYQAPAYRIREWLPPNGPLLDKGGAPPPPFYNLNSPILVSLTNCLSGEKGPDNQNDTPNISYIKKQPVPFIVSKPIMQNNVKVGTEYYAATEISLQATLHDWCVIALKDANNAYAPNYILHESIWQVRPSATLKATNKVANNKTHVIVKAGHLTHKKALVLKNNISPIDYPVLNGRTCNQAYFNGFQLKDGPTKTFHAPR